MGLSILSRFFYFPSLSLCATSNRPRFPPPPAHKPFFAFAKLLLEGGHPPHIGLFSIDGHSKELVASSRSNP